MKRPFNPCIDHCYTRYGKQYSEECDKSCEYAMVMKENKDLKNAISNMQKCLKDIYSTDG